MPPNNKMLKNKKANDKDKYIKLMNDFYDFNLTSDDFSNENSTSVLCSQNTCSYGIYSSCYGNYSLPCSIVTDIIPAGIRIRLLNLY